LPKTPFKSRWRRLRLSLLLIILVAVAGFAAQRWYTSAHTPRPPATAAAHHQPAVGSISQIIQTTHYSADQVTLLARQNYGASFPASPYGVTQVLLTYVSTGLHGNHLTVYARAYIPDTTGTSVIAMAPGTTGVGPTCAASLELPATRNWANYESHMMAYASQGFTGIITDYDNTHGADAVQPYMIGQLEGQAVLDSVRALKHLPAARHATNFSHVFAAGYSQGGHAAYWADSLQPAYAPDIKLSGVIGWGPVMDVSETWSDILHGANINWFGPYVLVSYADYYDANYNVSNILLPQWQTHLQSDVLSHCIDTDDAFWGSIPSKVYTKGFLQDLATGTLPDSKYGSLQENLEANQTGNATTATPKLINEGQDDNVVLPAQQEAAFTRLCASSLGPVKLTTYPGTTHYTVMKNSFSDSVAWMRNIVAGHPPATTCPAGSPSG
jgi:hypothetical protein